MKKLLFLSIAISFLYVSCQKDSLDLHNHSHDVIENDLSSTEADMLCKMGIEPNQVASTDDYLIYHSDIAISRTELQNIIESDEDKQFNVGTAYVPKISKVGNVSIYVDPSFSGLGPDWMVALNEAMNEINGIPHSRVTLNEAGTLGNHDIWLFGDQITDPSIPSCFKNIGAAGRANYPLNEDVGPYLSIREDGNWTAFQKVKLLIHELGHNFGMMHSCYNNSFSGVTSCGAAPFTVSHIETTWGFDGPQSQNADTCDIYSVMYAYGLGIGSLSSGNTPLSNPVVNTTPTNNGITTNSQWLTEDDIYAWQAMYPKSYKNFDFEISQCSLVAGYPDFLANPGLFTYELNYMLNDFIPYEIIFELIDANGTLLAPPYKTYRYWPDSVAWDDTGLDPYTNCLSVRVTFRNFKQDVVATHNANNCCTM